MKLDKQTILLFGGGLLVGYLICKYMSKSSVSSVEPIPAPQGNEQV